jgi:hypothetical protein
VAGNGAFLLPATNNGLAKTGRNYDNKNWSCAVSSVVEHHIDTVGVTGSNPVSRTIFSVSQVFPFLRYQAFLLFYPSGDEATGTLAKPPQAELKVYL